MLFTLDSKHNTSNEDSVDDLPGSAVELESKNKVIFLDYLYRRVLLLYF